MIPSIFRKSEREHILSHLEEWQSLKGRGKERDDDGDLFSPRDRLVDRIVHGFFERFPERDVCQSPRHQLAFAQDDRDKLHTRIRQLMYNTVARGQAKVQTSGPVSFKGVSVTTLFKQRYADRILAHRNRIETSTDPSRQMRAYNIAVREELALLQEEDPNAYQALQNSVQEMKVASSLGFEQQDTDVQKAILDLFPGEIQRTIKEWERRTGAAIYIMAAWTDADKGPSGFDYASTSCGRYLHSPESAKVRDIWYQWMKDHLLHQIIGDADSAPPSVYPNEHGWPMLPDLDELNLLMAEEKQLLRRWFACISFAMGGGQPSYTHIERQMESNPGSVISLDRMPPGINNLRDMKHWTRAILDKWIQHILKGQRGQLTLNQLFGWRLVPPRPGQQSQLVLSFKPELSDNAKVSWTPTELLYAQKMHQNALEGPTPVLAERWAGLPVARKSHIYAAYSIDLYHSLMTLHEHEPDMRALIAEVAEMEHEGPVHVPSSMSSEGSAYSPHIPRRGEVSLTKRLNPAEWLPLEAYDTAREGHSLWSLTALHLWISQAKPHVHLASGTVYGGPYGARCIVFALSRILQCLNRIQDDDDVPWTIGAILAKQDNQWSIAQATHLTALCIRTFRDQIKASRGVLTSSLAERHAAWEAGVERQFRGLRLRPEGEEDIIDIGVSVTSGVPENANTVREMWTGICHRRAQEESDEEAEEVSVVVRRRIRPVLARVRTIASESDSAERISFGDLGSSATHDSKSQSDRAYRQSMRGDSSMRSLEAGSSMQFGSLSSSVHMDQTQVVVPPPDSHSAGPSESVGNAEDAADMTREELPRRRRSLRATTRKPEADEAIRQARKGNYWPTPEGTGST